MKKQLLCALLILALLLPCAGLAERNALEGTAWQGIDRDTLYTLTFRDGTYCLQLSAIGSEKKRTFTENEYSFDPERGAYVGQYQWVKQRGKKETIITSSIYFSVSDDGQALLGRGYPLFSDRVTFDGVAFVRIDPEEANAGSLPEPLTVETIEERFHGVWIADGGEDGPELLVFETDHVHDLKLGGAEASASVYSFAPYGSDVILYRGQEILPVLKWTDGVLETEKDGRRAVFTRLTDAPMAPARIGAAQLPENTESFEPGNAFSIEAILHSLWLAGGENGTDARTLMVFEGDHVHYVTMDGADVSSAVFHLSFWQNHNAVMLSAQDEAAFLLWQGETLEADPEGGPVVFRHVRMICKD